MKKGLIAGAIAVFAVVLMLDANIQGGDKKEEKKGEKEITIKMVMKAHGKGGLLSKVQDGSASPEEKKKLLSLYEALGKATPPKGDAASWKEKTDALAKAVRDDDTAGLKKAANCMACHKEHKGKKS